MESSATELLAYPPAFTTSTPFSLAKFTSTWSKPVNATAISFKFFEFEKASFLKGWLAIIAMSESNTLSCNSSLLWAILEKYSNSTSKSASFSENSIIFFLTNI